MTLKDLRKRVYALLAEDEESDRVTESTVTFALNSGYRELAKRACCFTKSVSIAAVHEQASYALPTNMHTVVSVCYNGEALPLSYPGILDREAVGWREEAAGTPQVYLREDVRSVRLYPAPVITDAVELVVHGLIYPAAAESSLPLLNQDDDCPALPEEFHDVLADFAVFDIASRMLADDTGAQARGQAAQARFGEAVRSLAAYLGGV